MKSSLLRRMTEELFTVKAEMDSLGTLDTSPVVIATNQANKPKPKKSWLGIGVHRGKKEILKVKGHPDMEINGNYQEHRDGIDPEFGGNSPTTDYSNLNGQVIHETDAVDAVDGKFSPSEMKLNSQNKIIDMKLARKTRSVVVDGLRKCWKFESTDADEMPCTCKTGNSQSTKKSRHKSGGPEQHDLCISCRSRRALNAHQFERSLSLSAVEHTNSKELTLETLALDSEEFAEIETKGSGDSCVSQMKDSEDTPHQNNCVEDASNNELCDCSSDSDIPKSSSPCTPSSPKVVVFNLDSRIPPVIDEAEDAQSSTKNNTNYPYKDGQTFKLDLSDSVNKPIIAKVKHKTPPTPRQSWLLRLFESKLFDMSIAISYLFNSKEPGVQTYIGELR